MPKAEKDLSYPLANVGNCWQLEITEGTMIVNILESKADAILVAVPMIGIMIAAFFRMDELIGKPGKASEPRRKIAGSDANGFPLCMDPDGAQPRRTSKRR